MIGCLKIKTMRKYVLVVLPERRLRAICTRLVKQDFYYQVSTSTVEMTRHNRLKFRQGAAGKSEQIAWDGCEDAITEGA